VIDEMRAVLALDPLSVMPNCDLATSYTYAGRYDDALKQYDSTLELEPGNLRTTIEKGWCMLHAGRVQEGLELVKGVVKVAPIPAFQGIHALGLALAGRRNEALETLDRLRSAHGDGRLHFNFSVYALD
jgi:tetratricopeptide (TPR) repeat protein